MTTLAEITVVVPAHRAASFIAATLETVVRQTLRPAEVIVVDDGSSDDTVARVEEFAARHQSLCIRVLREPHRGPGAARNAGIRAARTAWIAFLDSDDLWQPNKLAVTSRYIGEHPRANFFCHNEVIQSLDGSTRASDYAVGFRLDAPIPPQLYRRNFFSTSAVVCSRDLLLKWNGFDEHLSSAQDYELWLRMSPDLVPVFIPDALGTYVMRTGNITTTRFWRRWRNLLRVKHRHRDKTNAAGYVSASMFATVVHFATPIRGAARRLLGTR